VQTATFDPNRWGGDYEALTGLDQTFLADSDLCEQTFANKQEAFTAGWRLGLEQSPADKPTSPNREDDDPQVAQ
jgi:hypothetical protein